MFLYYFLLHGFFLTSLSMNPLQPACEPSLVCPLCAHVTPALGAGFAVRHRSHRDTDWHATLTVRWTIALPVRSRSGLLALCVSWYTRLISGAGSQTVQISFSLVKLNSLACLQVIMNQKCPSLGEVYPIYPTYINIYVRKSSKKEWHSMHCKINLKFHLFSLSWADKLCLPK